MLWMCTGGSAACLPHLSWCQTACIVGRLCIRLPVRLMLRLAACCCCHWSGCHSSPGPRPSLCRLGGAYRPAARCAPCARRPPYLPAPGPGRLGWLAGCRLAGWLAGPLQGGGSSCCWGVAGEGRSGRGCRRATQPSASSRTSGGSSSRTGKDLHQQQHSKAPAAALSQLHSPRQLRALQQLCACARVRAVATAAPTDSRRTGRGSWGTEAVQCQSWRRGHSQPLDSTVMGSRVVCGDWGRRC